MHPQFRFVRKALYALKRNYPLAITLCSSTVNYDLATGFQNEVVTRYTIAKAIVLPTRESRQFLPELRAIAPFAPGAAVDSKLRKVIVDRRDLPATYEPSLDHFIVFSNKRYQVVTFDEFEHNEAIIFYINMNKGAPFDDSYGITDTLTLTDGATYVVQ